MSINMTIKYKHIQEVDMVPFPLELSLETLKHITVEYVAFISQYAILQPWPFQESQFRVIVRPFDVSVSSFF